ncbi:TRAP transporter large permease [Alkalihalobacillus sp. MEB130]|uniref:TRAP transporter large permease n=1 Tax=Alkalihalobacillus sp. MEB130 TaxID=2976704 RepID=UPI0028DFFA4A|nr:TRAP transporter large permease [Alkalihalobacillus sp. MEB130]MDT8860199.1 TRAP transporter large permease [Alkalihalobacillus sp. MEB130]
MNLDPQLIGVLGLILMVILVFLRVPVGFVMILVGFIGFALIRGSGSSFTIMGNTFYEALSDYNFTAIPLFILMGFLAYYCGIVTQLFDTAKKWVGHLPGGMAQVTIFGGAGFGAVSGSGPASTATLSKIAYPEMVKTGVDKKLAYGVIASVGPLAVMIPPSILMIVFAIITQQSIGKLLIGGLLPGIVAAIVYMILVYILVKRKPEIAPSQSKSSFKEKMLSLKGIGPFAILVITIVAGLYSGIFTPTEAGGMGAFVVFIMVLIKHGFKWEIMKNSMIETMKTTCMIFILVGGTFVFSYFLSVSRIPTQLSQFLVSLPVEPIVIILGIILLYLILGMFIEMISAMFLTLPIIFPAVIALGYDPIWFGVLLVFLVEVALVTPPFGMSLFILKGTVPGSDLRDIYRGAVPFIFADFVIIALFLLFPQIITFLPSLMG